MRLRPVYALAIAPCLLFGIVACGGDGPSGGGSPTQLVLAVQPSGSLSGLPLTSQPVVQLAGSNGRLTSGAASAAVSVRIALGTGTLVGTTTVGTVGGVATFTNLRIDGAGAHTLTFESGSLASVTSLQLGVQQVPAALVVDAAPAGAFSERPLQMQPRVSVRDNAGLVITSSTALITATRAAGSGTLSGTTAVRAITGVATFSDLMIIGLGSHQLQFTMTPGPSQLSDAFDVTPPPPLVAVDLSAGAGHTCAISTLGVGYCWGANPRGQLGDSTTTMRLRPGRIRGAPSLLSVSAGYDHSCALGLTGIAWCWGSSEFSQLGGAVTNYIPYAVEVPTAARFVELVVGGTHTCARTAAGIAHCWGMNSFGALGVGHQDPRPSTAPVAGSLAFSQLRASSTGTCGRTPSGDVHCWGAAFQDSDTTTLAQDTPTPRAVGYQFDDFTHGNVHTCGRQSTVGWYCWGVNSQSQFGNGITLNAYVPERNIALDPFVTLSFGFARQCGLTASGAAFCWGWNDYGQIGDGTTTERYTPTAVSGGLAFSRISLGVNHTCGLSTTGQVYCWGQNIGGQLGDGTIVSRSVPTLISPP